MIPPRDMGISAAHLGNLREAFRKSALPGQVIEVWLFGSRARGTQRKYSDVDLLIEATPPMDAAQKSRLDGALEESDLPFKVDCVASAEVYQPYRTTITIEKRVLFSLKGDARIGS